MTRLLAVLFAALAAVATSNESIHRSLRKSSHPNSESLAEQSNETNIFLTNDVHLLNTGVRTAAEVSSGVAVGLGEDTLIQRSVLEDDDLGIRFNIIRKYENYSGPDILTAQDFPLSNELAYTLCHHSGALCHHSGAASMITMDDYELAGINLEDYVQAAGGYPTMPSRDPDAEYWNDLGIVVKAQIDRRNGVKPTFTLPDFMKDWSANQVAESVHDG